MKAFEYEPVFKKTELDNGLTVVTEHHPYTRTTSSGIFVEVGTRDEPEDLLGAAHFMEHLVFKGTKTRTAYQIAKSMEEVGGDLNAYTGKEYTCFHVATLKEHTRLGLDVLADLVTEARFSENDYKKELDVVKHEIGSSKDQVDEYIFDLYFEHAYKNHVLGRNILGTEDSLNSFKLNKVKDFYKTHYTPKKFTLSVAGSVDHDEVVRDAKKLFPKTKSTAKKTFAKKKGNPKVQPFSQAISRDSEQVHILMGLPSADFVDDLRFEGYIVNAFLGGGMTSQLYQKVREKKGWAYTVYSYLHAFTDSGLMMVYAGTSQKKYKDVYKVMVDEMLNLKAKGMKESTVDFYKTQVLGQILMGADDVESRMNSIGVNEMVFHKYRSVDEVVKDIERVSTQSIQRFLNRYFDFNKLGVIVMGPNVKALE